MQILRYAANGVAATAIHYIVLYTCVEILNFRFIGLANLLASSFGILTSFFGNKHFVFKSTGGSVSPALARFIFFYAIIALIHGAILHVWSDIYRMNYNQGFVFAILIQFLLGYMASKFFVFNESRNKNRG